MCETGLIGIVKELIHAQNLLGTLQLLLLIFAWLPVLAPVVYFGQQELKCEVDKGKNDYVNSLCTRLHTEQHFWTTTKKAVAACTGLAVYATWLAYLVYVYYKTHGEQEPPAEKPFRRPGLRKCYIAQIALRIAFLVAFLVFVISPVVPHPSITSPAAFNCTLSETTGERQNGSRYVLCADKYNKEKTGFSIAVLALAAVIFVLSLIELCCELCVRNTEESTKESTQSYSYELRERIRNLTNWKKKLFNTDRDLKFDEIFTDLLVYQGRVSHTLWQHDLYEREGNLWQYAEPSQIGDKLNSPDDLIKPLPGESQASKILFVTGRAGIGKTTLCEKILRGWAEDKLFSGQYDYAFLLNFRQLNLIKKDISLRNLLDASPASVPVDETTFSRIKDFPEKVLLIFDGFDEFRDQGTCKEVAEGLPDRGAVDTMPVGALYYKLCSGKLLPNATVITTMRACPAAESIKDDREVINPRTVEVLGFDKPKIREYIKKYFGEDDSRSEAAARYVTSRADLLALCYVPVNCFLVCYCLEHAGSFNDDAFPVTLTELYQRIVKLFMRKHSTTGGGERTDETKRKALNEAALRKLSKLAFDGIKEERLIFDEEIMKDFSQTDLASYGIIHEMPGVVTKEMEFSSQYIFLHLTIQEFLAARHFVQEMPGEEFETFIAQIVAEPRWRMVVQFVAGLLRHKDNATLQRNAMFKAALSMKEDGLLFIKCLFEYHNEDFVKECEATLGEEIDLTGSGATDADCTAISFCCRHACTKSLGLPHCRIGPAGCAELARLMQTSQIAELDVTHNDFGDEGAEHLKEALQHRNCKLQTLDLDFTEISDKGAEHLKEALQHSNCKLQTLYLDFTEISDNGAEHLKEALQHTNCKLQTLNLGGTQVGDKGAEHLKEALQHSSCKLQTLNLGGTRISDKGAEHLKEALQHSQCELKTLNLGDTRISDKGAEHLKEALQHSNCKLQTLNLGDTRISDKGAEHLKEALQHSNCKLQTLNLGGTQIRDKGAEHLKEALQHSNCKLQTLYLGHTRIRDKGAEHLKEALQHSNCKLQTLDLGHTRIRDKGAEHLKGALQHSNFKLQTLNLGSTRISDKGSEHLKEALQYSHCKFQTVGLPAVRPVIKELIT